MHLWEYANMYWWCILDKGGGAAVAGREWEEGKECICVFFDFLYSKQFFNKFIFNFSFLFPFSFEVSYTWLRRIV